MRAIILACQTLHRELRLALEKTKVDYSVVYIESGLHNEPEALRRRIQEQLDMFDNVDVVLLVFGFCGNGLAGIKSSKFKLVIPRIHDCIPMLLGSADKRKAISKEMGTYFLTQGWLDYEKNILWEYERCLERYGETRTKKVMKTMLGHYKRLLVIDTGAYSVEQITPRTMEFAEQVGLQHEVGKGSLRLIEKLLTGEWDDEMLVLEPGQEITMTSMCIDVSEVGLSQVDRS
ncbi:MAG: hypothetical protein H6Q67_441 [Firmicutes bacterium]|nr:hypothetical protein [Bacillota bacterium]